MQYGINITAKQKSSSISMSSDGYAELKKINVQPYGYHYSIFAATLCTDDKFKNYGTGACYVDLLTATPAWTSRASTSIQLRFDLSDEKG